MIKAIEINQQTLSYQSSAGYADVIFRPDFAVENKQELTAQQISAIAFSLYKALTPNFIASNWALNTRIDSINNRI